MDNQTIHNSFPNDGPVIFEVFPEGVDSYQPPADDDAVLLSGDYADFLASVPPHN